MFFIKAVLFYIQEGNITLTVALDAMGGDNAPGEIIRGAVNALSVCEDLSIIIVGVESRVNACLKDLRYPEDRVRVVHAPDIISGFDDPGIAVRRKKLSSMVVALKLVSSGSADAFVGAGNTGAIMAGGLLFMGRVPGVSRPALLATIPGFRGDPSVVLDVGANMDASPEQLLQYSFMGTLFAKEVLKRNEPSVSLLNVGTEPNKGNIASKATFSLLEQYMPSFKGNVEGTQVFDGISDVIVCDGFVGNIFLKSTEAIFREVFLALKNDLSKNFKSKIGVNLIYGSIREIYKKIDDSQFGGAPLVGVNGICVKCHGSSNSQSIKNAIINTVYPLVSGSVPQKLERLLLKQNCTYKELKGNELE